MFVTHDQEEAMEVAVSDGQEVWVQISRRAADRLALQPGSDVSLRPVSAHTDIVTAARQI